MTLLQRILYLTGTALLLLTTLTAQATVVELNRIVAVVDDEVITALELERQLSQIKRELTAKRVQLPGDDVLRPQVLERMVSQRIQVAQAKRSNIQIGDEELNNIIANIADRNKLTLDQFQQALQQQGLDFSEFREQIRNEVLISRLLQRAVESRILITPQEVESYIRANPQVLGADEEYHLAHILVAIPEGSGPEVIAEKRAKLESIQGLLGSGEDFQQLAIRYSDGQQALEGGDLGWRRAAQLPSLFGDVVTGMAIGAVSEPLRSPSGFHMIKLLEKRGGQQHMVQQTHARHILIRTGDLVSDQEAQARLQRLRERILNGEDFAELARAHSEDPGSAVKGGDLGWASPGLFVPQFETAMDALAIDEISQPIRSDYGWHLIQVLGRRDYDNSEDLRRNQIMQTLRQRKIEEETESWLRRLRDEAYVEIRLEQ